MKQYALPLLLLLMLLTACGAPAAPVPPPEEPPSLTEDEAPSYLTCRRMESCCWRSWTPRSPAAGMTATTGKASTA